MSYLSPHATLRQLCAFYVARLEALTAAEPQSAGAYPSGAGTRSQVELDQYLASMPP